MSNSISRPIVKQITPMSPEQPKSLSPNMLTLSPPYSSAIKNDPVFLKYGIISSWDKDMRVQTRKIHLGLRLERIKQKIQSLVQ